ncbi:MAG TPA: hypothetical protein VL651_03910 [Bacteroidia bacterium]|jgi:hypothetical protein|nr:hypothetical protein [Bacteroidia bacterium]
MPGIIKKSTKTYLMKRFFTPAALVLTVCTFGLFLVNGCLKENSLDTETTSATDNNICEGEFMRVLPTVNKIAIDEPGVHRYGSNHVFVQSCPSVMVDTGTQANQWPRYMTIDYGTGCTDSIDGKIRKGKIHMTLAGPWDVIGSVATITLDTFFVGAIQYEGTVTLTRTGTDTWHKTVTNGKCTKNSATAPWTILFACDRDITFTSGNTSSSVSPVITISGTNSGTDRNGTQWTSTIDPANPIVRDLGCTWITKGKVTLTPAGKSDRVVDFGNGTCDNKGTVTIDGNTFEFSMQ